MEHPVLDLRLVPAALTAWAVTAAGISWEAGFGLAVVNAVVALGCWVAGRRFGDRWPALRAGASVVLGAAVVGAGFGVAVGLRCEEAANHVLAGRTGATVSVRSERAHV